MTFFHLESGDYTTGSAVVISKDHWFFCLLFVLGFFVGGGFFCFLFFGGDRGFGEGIVCLF